MAGSLDTNNANAIKNNNIFGLPFTVENARLVILPAPWEVTASYITGTARAPEHILNASLKINLYDVDGDENWQQGIFMLPIDKQLLLRNDYLRKEAELYINFLQDGGNLAENEFLQRNVKEVNEGCEKMNEWVAEQTENLLQQNKLVALLGGDHSVALGYIKSLAEKEKDIGILQIDAHTGLRKSYNGFTYSNATVMHNVLKEVPQVKKIVQIGVRDFCEEEILFIGEQPKKIATFFEKDLRARQYEGTTWSQLCDEIIEELPQKIYISFDIDGLDPKLCPHTGMPVPGGFETGEIFYLIKKIIAGGKKIIGFDLCEVNYRPHEWDAIVGARILFRLCNFTIGSNS